jgi:hypothetical protein
MISNQFSLINSWIESDRYVVYRYQLSFPKTQTFQIRLRIGFDGTIEEFQSEDTCQLSSSNFFLLVNDAIREFNARL